MISLYKLKESILPLHFLRFQQRNYLAGDVSDFLNVLSICILAVLHIYYD